METEIALTVDLRWLVYSTLLLLVLWIPYMLSAMMVRGAGRLAGYPTGNYSDLPEWAQRNWRAHMNLVENLAPFAALVIVAHLTGTANATTAGAAQVFFWARLVQAAVHIAAVPWLRTIAFTVAWIACLVIMYEILV